MDDSEALEKLILDISLCFNIITQSLDYNNHNEEFYRLIYETKLPEGIEIYRNNDIPKRSFIRNRY